MKHLRRFGSEYGGRYYPENLEGLNNDSIVYCVGAGEDITHDIEIAWELGSNVYIFDPTPRAVQHVKFVCDVLDGKKNPIINKNFGGGDELYWDRILLHKIDTSKIIFRDWGLGTKCGNFKFYEPKKKHYVSHSLVHGMKGNNYINVKVKDLKTIMQEFGHDNIDLLKLDIEGIECDVIDDMLDKSIFPKYISIDFDLGWTGGKNVRDKQRCFDTIDRLLENGYEIIHSKGPDYSFKKIDL
jgi:hypothetical protein